MKLADVLKIAAPFLATDKKPEQLQAAILAADKKAKDAAGSGLGSRELEEKDQPKGQDWKAYDAMEEACDSREEAMDAAEEEADKGKGEDKAAKDRKGARDARKGARDARKGARDARKAARDARKAARDRNDDPEGTNATDEDYTEGADPTTPGGNRAKGKTAIDSAEADRRIAVAIAARDALHDARREVEPILGVVAMDSAEAVYRAALDKLGVDHKDVTAPGLRTLLTVAKDRAAAASPAPLTVDSATVAGIDKLIPGYSRLK